MAQNVVLYGKMIRSQGYESSKSEPAAGVKMQLVQGDRTWESTTNAGGKFEFTDMPVGTYQLRAMTSKGRSHNSK